MRTLKSPTTGNLVVMSDRQAAYELGRDIGWVDVTDAPDGDGPKPKKTRGKAVDPDSTEES